VLGIHADALVPLLFSLRYGGDWSYAAEGVAAGNSSPRLRRGSPCPFEMNPSSLHLIAPTGRNVDGGTAPMYPGGISTPVRRTETTSPAGKTIEDKGHRFHRISGPCSRIPPDEAAGRAPRRSGYLRGELRASSSGEGNRSLTGRPEQ